MIHDTPVLLIRWRIGHLVKKKTQARNYLENVLENGFIRAHFLFDLSFFWMFDFHDKWGFRCFNTNCVLMFRCFDVSAR